jgi:ParB-like chromosome segregation protein Spo0J
METSTDPPADRRVSPTAELEHHSAAALFPLLAVNGPECGELVADIGAQGLLRPIVLHEGQILDGRNRHRACHHAGAELRAG